MRMSGIVGHAGRLEAHAGERLDEGAQRHAVLQAVADRDGEGVHDPGEGRALLRDPEEDLAGPAVVVLADGDEALAVGHPELEGAAPAGPGQLLADRHLDDLLDDLLDHLGDDLRRGAAAAPPRRRPSWPSTSGWATLQLSR